MRKAIENGNENGNEAGIIEKLRKEKARQERTLRKAAADQYEYLGKIRILVNCPKEQEWQISRWLEQYANGYMDAVKEADKAIEKIDMITCFLDGADE